MIHKATLPSRSSIHGLGSAYEKAFIEPDMVAVPGALSMIIDEIGNDFPAA